MVIYFAFSRNHFMEGCFMFQWGASFLSGGDHGGASVLAGGGVSFEKNCNDVSPHYGKPRAVSLC